MIKQCQPLNDLIPTAQNWRATQIPHLLPSIERDKEHTPVPVGELLKVQLIPYRGMLMPPQQLFPIWESPKENTGLNFLLIPKLAANWRINFMPFSCKQLYRMKQKKMAPKMLSMCPHRMAHLHLRGQENKLILLNTSTIITIIHSIRMNTTQIIMDFFTRRLL